MGVLCAECDTGNEGRWYFMNSIKIYGRLNELCTFTATRYYLGNKEQTEYGSIQNGRETTLRGGTD